jgi:exosortase
MSELRDRRSPWPAALCAFAGVFLFQFWGNSTHGYLATHSLFYWWGFQWFNRDSETQHGVLILAVSVFLLARNLAARPSGPQGGDGAARAAAAMAGGLLLHVVGFVAEQARISILGLLLYAWGVIALAGGPRWARAASFPVAFMVFAIPINALDSAGFWLRMWVVGASAKIAHGLGIAVLVNGTQLLSPDGRYNYDVAAACSGVRSLVALSALSLLIGYIRFRPGWLAAFLFGLSFPLIFVGNVARIVSIVVSAQLGGRVWGDRAHEVMGFGVFAIVLGGAFLAAEAVARMRPDWVRGDPDPGAGNSPGFAGPAGGARGGSPRRWAAAAGIALAAILAAGALNHVAHMPPSGRSGIALAPDGLSPVELPTFLGSDWIGRRTEVTQVEREVLPPDTGYSRKIYVSLEDPSRQVFLSIVLTGRDRTSIHRPELCLVGQGWTIRGSFAHTFRYPGSASGFPATVLRVEKEAVTPGGRIRVPQLFAYYFVGGDTVVATHWDRIALDAWNRVAHGRSDRWAYVVVQTGDSDGEAAALARIQAILDGTLAVFQKQGREPGKES